MKKQKMWMLAAILTCGLGTVLTACSDKDGKADKQESAQQADASYAIEVEPGLTMPVNNLETRIKTLTNYDKSVVTALQRIDGVTDVKPYDMAVATFNESLNQFFGKTAYYFNFKQLVDHNDPSKGYFKQQCIITVAGKDRPTVVETCGYALTGADQPYTNSIDQINLPILVQVLNANSLHVEHRYHGWSLPEGWTNRWNYLDAKQQADDLHAIVTAIKKSGVVGKDNKWLSTGVSKDGSTTIHYAYYYPNDVDAYVPFSSPFTLSLEDERAYRYICSPEALGSRYEKVKTAFRTFFGDKKLQADIIAYLKKYSASYADFSDETIRLYLMNKMIRNHFQKMSFVPYTKWESWIPEPGDNVVKYLNYIFADSNTRYPSDTQGEYERRTVNDEENQESIYADNETRAAGAIKERYFPYDIQCLKQLGVGAIACDWIKEYLTAEEQKELFVRYDPAKFGVSYDGGAFMRSLLEGMKQSDCHICYVYGMQDPWTAHRIPDEYLGKNSFVLLIKDGLHNDYIDTWNFSERNILFQWLQGLGFDL